MRPLMRARERSKTVPLPNLGESAKILIVGRGHFGVHLHQLLHDKVPQLAVDVHEPGPKHIGDGSFPICDYDVIVLAVPIRVYEEVIQDIMPRMKESAVVVDVATVKEHTRNVLEKHAGDRYWVSTHPTWGPQSYEKTGGDIRGYRLIVTDHTLPRSTYKQLRALLVAVGIVVVEMTPSRHDGHLAQTLFATHFFGQVVSSAGLTRTEIDTVSFGLLMSMVESVQDDTQLFLDVFHYAPRPCRRVLERIENATHQVRLMIEGART